MINEESGMRLKAIRFILGSFYLPSIVKLSATPYH